MGKSDVISEPSVTFARNVDWNLFKVFHEIARRGGIGAAARALNKKQPSITAALRRLGGPSWRDALYEDATRSRVNGSRASAPGRLRKPAGLGSKHSTSDFRRQRGGFRHGNAARTVELVQPQSADRHLR
jgi:DNA-binding transcriptional LysR family regulator